MTTSLMLMLALTSAMPRTQLRPTPPQKATVHRLLGQLKGWSAELRRPTASGQRFILKKEVMGKPRRVSGNITEDGKVHIGPPQGARPWGKVTSLKSD